MQGTGYAGEGWRRLVLRLVLKFAGENVSDEDLTAMLAESEKEEEEASTDAGSAVTQCAGGRPNGAKPAKEGAK